MVTVDVLHTGDEYTPVQESFSPVARRAPSKPGGSGEVESCLKKAATVSLESSLSVDAQAGDPGGVLGKALPLTIMILRLRLSMTPSRWSSLITLETAPGRGDHVGQVLVGESHVYQCAHTVALPKALAQAERREPGRDFPVQQALYHLIGLPEPLGERGESWRAKPGSLFITRSMDAFWMLATRESVTASAKTSLPASLDQVELAEDAPSFRSAVVASL